MESAAILLLLVNSAHVLRDRTAPHTGATRRHQRAAEGLPTLLVPLNQSFDVHTGVGPRCGALPGYKPVNTYNNRAPIRVAEALSRLAEGKRFVEISTRRDDVFMYHVRGGLRRQDDSRRGGPQVLRLPQQAGRDRLER